MDKLITTTNGDEPVNSMLQSEMSQRHHRDKKPLKKTIPLNSHQSSDYITPMSQKEIRQHERISINAATNPKDRALDHLDGGRLPRRTKGDGG